MPQRFLRPGIRNSDHWNSVSFRAQSFYVRILTLVDDFGRYDGRPSVLHGECWSVWNEKHPDLAVTPQETAADCCALQREKLAIFYEIAGKKVLQLLQWQERSRSDKSKWPDPPQDSAAERSGTLPPSPSPSPVHPRPSPPPEPDAGAAVELPPRFPKTVDDAISQAFTTGATAVFITDTYNKALSRGGKDAKECPILSWPAYVATELKFERARLQKEKQTGINGHLLPSQQFEILKQQIDNHPANRTCKAWLCGRETEAQKKELAELRAKLATLKKV